MGKRTRLKVLALILTAILIIPVTPLSYMTESNAQSHPFLLVSESEYAELQARANKEPWKTWKSTAIADAKSLTFSTSAGYSTRVTQMRDIMESCALAYILDPSNRSTYATKVYNTIGYWVSGVAGNILDSIVGGTWEYYIPPAAAYFSTVVALDIVYPTLTASQRSTAENRLQAVHDKFWNTNANWDVGVWGARGIWPLYKNSSQLNTAANSYYTALTGYLTSDGICTSGVGYANIRFSGDRHTKQYYMDVLTHAGVYNYYNDHKVKNFYEWLYGYGATPFRTQWTFGDSYFGNTFYTVGSIWKADRISADASKGAANILGSTVPRGRIFTYVLHKTPYPTGQRPPSKIFPDGGAFFNENSAATTALSSVLWNPKSKKDDHCHKEVNAIGLAGYGEYLLANAGYNGWGAGLTVSNMTFSWNYINNRAVSGNTALINYSPNFTETNPTSSGDHLLKYGNGITEGFTTPVFCYASGDSGNALSNDGSKKHIRNLVFVGPQDSKNGYWILFDEMKGPTGSGNTAHLALHPPSATYSTTTSNTEYKWTMNKVTGKDVNLSIFLGTPPSSPSSSIPAVAIKNGCVGGGNTKFTFLTKYLYTTYNITDSQGRKNIVTVLFPHDSTHAKATMSRISGSGYTGASINLGGGAIDYALESFGTSNITYSGVTFRGLCTLYRKVNGATNFYFVRKGRTFNDGGSTRRGFESTGDVSVYIKDKSGMITSSGSSVTFYYPGITGVKLNGSNVAVQSSGANWVKVNVPSGTHSVEFTTGSVPTVTPTPTPTPTTPTPSPTPVPNGWYGKASFTDGIHNLGTTNTGKVHVQFDVTPLASGLNACIGYADSSTNVTTWNHPAMTIRMNTSGTFDVRNGGAFAATTTLSYTPNQTYHVRMIADLVNKKYDVWITPPGGNEVKITDNYSFRSDAPATDDLGKLSLKDDANDRYVVRNHTVSPIWYGKASFPDGVINLGAGNTGKRLVEFDVIPLASGLNACIGYADSSTNVTTWNHPAMTIRLNTNNTFDVRNGGGFAATTTVSYTPNKVYHVRMITDLVNKKCDVWITPPGGSEIKITNNYSFRSDAPATDDLGKISLKDDANDRFMIVNHKVTEIASSQPVAFNPVADTFIRDGDFASDNYGTQAVIAVKSSSPAGYNRKAYLKFNFRSLGVSSVSNATLRLYVYSADPSQTRSINVYGNAVENW